MAVVELPRITESDLQIDLYDDSPFSNSKTSNWVAKVGGLPPNVRARARAIKRKTGWPLSRCIATAINADKKAPKLNFNNRAKDGPAALARHKEAIADWDTKKAASHSKGKK